MELQQALVDPAEVPLGQVPVVNELAGYPREHVNRRLQVRVPDGMLLQERVAVRVEKAAVKRRHGKGRAALVYDLEQPHEARPQDVAVGQKRGAVRHVVLYFVQAVVLAIALAAADREQFTGLGVEDEQEPVQRDQGVIVDVFERIRPRVQAIRRIVQKTLGQVPQRLVDLAF